MKEFREQVPLDRKLECSVRRLIQTAAFKTEGSSDRLSIERIPDRLLGRCSVEMGRGVIG